MGKALLFAFCLEKLTVQCAEQPRLHFRRVAQLMSLGGPYVKRLLRQISGLGLLPSQAERKLVQSAIMLLHQFFEIRVRWVFPSSIHKSLRWPLLFPDVPKVGVLFQSRQPQNREKLQMPQLGNKMGHQASYKVRVKFFSQGRRRSKPHEPTRGSCGTRRSSSEGDRIKPAQREQGCAEGEGRVSN